MDAPPFSFLSFTAANNSATDSNIFQKFKNLQENLSKGGAKKGSGYLFLFASP
jgi:hypothetical protein